jgi:putative membrane protein
LRQDGLNLYLQKDRNSKITNATSPILQIHKLIERDYLTRTSNIYNSCHANQIMVFIDNLAFSLFAISIAGFMLLYSMVSIYLSYRKNQKMLSEHIRNTTVPLFFIGIYLLVMGLWGQFAWPLPGSYNILFYDPLVAFGIVMLTFATIGRLGGNMEYAGFLAFLFGVMAIIYGIAGYNVGLTLEPVALLAMYFLYGLTGILAYPIAMIAQRKPGLQKNHWGGWIILLGLFCLSIFAASCISGFIGFEAIGAHLLTTP